MTLGIFLLFCVGMLFLIIGGVIIACWNEGQYTWEVNFGDSIGQCLYKFNLYTNKCWENFWKNFWY